MRPLSALVGLCFVRIRACRATQTMQLCNSPSCTSSSSAKNAKNVFFFSRLRSISKKNGAMAEPRDLGSLNNVVKPTIKHDPSVSDEV